MFLLSLKKIPHKHFKQHNILVIYFFFSGLLFIHYLYVIYIAFQKVKETNKNILLQRGKDCKKLEKSKVIKLAA